MERHFRCCFTISIINNSPVYCVFHRADFDLWQFIAGGGEEDDTP